MIFININEVKKFIETLDKKEIEKNINESIARFKYERPYRYERLNDINPNLTKDPVHYFRAITGIEVIHKEPTMEEFNRIWLNWQKMNTYLQNISNVFSRKVNCFYDNLDGYDIFTKNYKSDNLPFNLYIDKSDISGDGVFVNIAMPSGTKIGEMFKQNIPTEELSNPDKDYSRTLLGSKINHSNNNNCKLIKKYSRGRGFGDSWWLKTIRKIESGEELTINYNEIPWDGKRDFDFTKKKDLKHEVLQKNIKSQNLSFKLYKISKLIIAGNVKQLSNIFQDEWLKNNNKSNYNELDEKEKEVLKQYIEDRKKEIEKEISSKVKNVQYKSWIYDILVKKDQFFEDIDKMIEEIENLEYLKKNKKTLNEILEIKLEDKDFDIKTYKTFGDLHKFTSEYLNLFKKRALNTNNLKPDFEKVFSGEKYDVYKITKDDKNIFKKLYGKNGYNTAWCVAGEDDYHFDEYLKTNLDYLYLFTFKNEKPYALLHFRTCQFKDIHDHSLRDFSDDILGFLGGFVEENQFGFDLEGYKFKTIKKKYPNIKPNELFVKLNKESKLNEDGSIDCFIVFKEKIKDFVKDGKLTIKFNKSSGDFNCCDCNLTSLEGCPQIVDGDFFCLNNHLTNLDGCPQVIKGTFSCAHNNLTSLEGCPRTINGDFDCAHNNLTSLEGCPQIAGGMFRCSNNKLTSLIGCPTVINKSFDCSHNELENLIGCPKVIKEDFYCLSNKLKTLDGFPEFIGRYFNCSGNLLKSLTDITQKIPQNKIFCKENNAPVEELLKTIKS